MLGAQMTFPIHIQQCSPYGGMGLRAASILKGRAKVLRLLDACAADRIAEEVTLEVTEPCNDLGFIRTVFDPGEHTAAATVRLSETLQVPDAMVASHTAPARAAWSSFGRPMKVGLHRNRKQDYISWIWAFGDRRPVGDLDGVRPIVVDFALEHDGEGFDEYTPALRVHESWNFRFIDPTTNEPAPTDVPRSQVQAWFARGRCSAFVELRFAHAEATPAFAAAWRHACASLGVKLPVKELRIVSPTRAGSAKYRKLAFQG